MDLLPNAVISRVAKRLLVTWQHPEIKLLEKGAILVNSHGKRFTNEASTPELAIPRQPDRIAYILLDQRLDKSFRSGRTSFLQHPISRTPIFRTTSGCVRTYPESKLDSGSCQKDGIARDQPSADRRGVQPSSHRIERRSTGQDFFFGAPLTQPPYWALGP